VHLHQVLLVAL
jgi:hypothetical protein